MEGVVGDLFGPVDDRRHIGDLDQSALSDVEHHCPDIPGRGQEGAGGDADHLIRFGEPTRVDVQVGQSESLGDHRRIDAERRHTVG